MADFDDYQEEFRDTIATVDQQGKRIWIYPKKPKGKFYDYRSYLSYFYLIVLFLLPFISWNGQPFVLLNVLERRFILFGFQFAPQDFYLFAIAMLIFVVFIVLFTVVYGRLFCGWVCPQTIFMELVFRKIEYWIDGDYNSQRKLDATPWNTNKWVKRILKHSIFIAISILIANTFLAYIIGLDEVITIIKEPISEHMVGFFSMIIFSLVFYGVFARLREQVCTTICPYGRLQGVLLDNRSLVVAYDFVRGEPRGKIKKDKSINLKVDKDIAPFSTMPLIKQSEEVEMVSAASVLSKNLLGDCIDCKLCIHVCPTGIDIRNGTQLECVNCTACMDACDEVMEKVVRPKGLIRIDSIEGIEKGTRHLWNNRVKAYTIVLGLLIAVEVLLLSLRTNIDVLLLRTPGMLSIQRIEGSTSNLYNYNIINKTSKSMTLTLKLKDSKGEIEMVGNNDITILGNEKASGSVFVNIPNEELLDGKTKIKVEVIDEQGIVITTVNSIFFTNSK